MITTTLSAVIPGEAREREDPGPRGNTVGRLPHEGLGPGSRAGATQMNILGIVARAWPG